MWSSTTVFYLVSDSDAFDSQSFTCSSAIRDTWTCIDYIVDRVADTFKHRALVKIWSNTIDYDVEPIINSVQDALNQLYRPILQDVL